MALYQSGSRLNTPVPILESQDDQQKHDLPLVQRRCAGSCEVLCRYVCGQLGGIDLPCAKRLPLGEGGGRPYGRIHGDGHPVSGPEWRGEFKQSEAFSFQVATDDQAETDRLWNAIVGNGGQESVCGWCKDKWGLSWQITPRALTTAINHPDRTVAKRAFEAMMTMGKIDIAALEAALKG